MASRKGIQLKIIAISLIGFLALGIAVSAIAIQNSRKSLIKARMDQLTSIRQGAREHIRNYMDLMGKLLISLAADYSIKQALLEYREGFYRILTEVDLSEDRLDQALTDHYRQHYLREVNYNVPNGPKPRPVEEYLPGSLNGKIAQYLYIAANPHPAGARDKLLAPQGADFTYAEVHRRYHPTLNAFLHNFDLYDVFLVDPDGMILYTDFKEMDYATSLISGPYRDTGLARAFTGAWELNEGEIAFDDFAPYEPSYNLPAAFIGTPVFVNGRKEGVFIIQIPIDKINAIMTFNHNYDEAGLGATGESYLVGRDRMMRNDSRFIADLDNSLARSLGTTIGILEVNTDSVDQAFAGRSGVQAIPDYRKIPVLSSFTTARIFDTDWAVIAEIDRSEALADTRLLTRNMILMSLVVIGIILAVMLFLVHRILAAPLSDILGKVKDLSKSGGDLNQKIQINSTDEMGQMAAYFNEFLEMLRLQMVKIKAAAETLIGSVQDLSVSSREIQTTSNNQAASVKEVVSTMEDSDKLSKSIAVKIEEVVRIADQTRENVEKGFTITKDNRNQMEEIRTTNSEVITGIKSLGDHINNIWEIVGIINSIADQTKIIAFNAELEASAAGEAGKNFEIVASEIRRLANNTMVSTKEIKSKIIEIQKASDNLILNSEDGTKKITAGWKLSAHLKEVFQQILDSSDTSAKSAHKITESIRQQVNAFEQILLTLKQISEGIDNFVVSTRSSTEASETLSAMAEELNAIVAEYKV